jgi:3',5'-cyclic AMP phosphodiesterase CpdA
MTPPTLRLAHLSDIHIYDLRGARPWDFLGKRATGGLNLLLKRGKIHQNQIALQALAQAREEGAHHTVITGDLTNLALRGEFEAARDLLQEHAGGPEWLSVIPGNHDYYTRQAVRRGDFEDFFSPWMRCALRDQSQAPYPYVKRLGPHGEVALIGVNSCVPSAPTLAIGRVGAPQRAELARLLALPALETTFRVVALHHHLEPPHHTSARKELFRQLRDRKEVLATLREGRADLVIHGHNHQHSTRQYPWTHGGGDVTVCEAGSSSVGVLREGDELRGGKFNLYDLVPGPDQRLRLARVHTWLYQPALERFSHWRTQELP